MAKQNPPPLSANITGVLGSSQTGKGQYCKARLKKPHRGLTLVWSVLEATDRYAPFLGAHLVNGSIPELVRLVSSKPRPRAIVYAPALDDFKKQFDWFCRIVAAPECRGARVLVEELSRVTRASWAPQSWKNLSTAGAHQGLELIATAQRPTHIDKDFIGNCTEIRCYRLFFEEDARSLGRALQVPYTEIQNLQKLHFFHRVIEDRRTVPGVQAVMR